MTVTPHHFVEIESDHTPNCLCTRAPACRGTFGPMDVWYWEDSDQPGVFSGRRGNPDPFREVEVGDGNGTDLA